VVGRSSWFEPLIMGPMRWPWFWGEGSWRRSKRPYRTGRNTTNSAFLAATKSRFSTLSASIMQPWRGLVRGATLRGASNFSRLEANAKAHFDLPVASGFLLRRASTQCSETIWP
jgi:hypothetical protein